MRYHAQKHCQCAIEILQNMSFGGGSDDESDSSKQASSSAKGKASKGSIRQVASHKRRTLEEAALGRRQPKTSRSSVGCLTARISRLYQFSIKMLSKFPTCL